MLEAARQRKLEGVDVAVGYLETHKRVETERIAQGLETVPRKSIEYHGVTLTEMNADAILVRHPALVLVDELAHTNAPGSRHPKRYLDVEELLEAGIDVYTTLNIQHLESLNDVVAQITGVLVQETIPDRVIDEANELELVDLPPEELLTRLREGKVYVPDQAARAIQDFFRKGNLTALREMTMRRAAERVDDQMRSYMQNQAIAGPWAAAERLLVCISPNPLGSDLSDLHAASPMNSMPNGRRFTFKRPMTSLYISARWTIVNTQWQSFGRNPYRGLITPALFMLNPFKRSFTDPNMTFHPIFWLGLTKPVAFPLRQERSRDLWPWRLLQRGRVVLWALHPVLATGFENFQPRYLRRILRLPALLSFLSIGAFLEVILPRAQKSKLPMHSRTRIILAGAFFLALIPVPTEPIYHDLLKHMVNLTRPQNRDTLMADDTPFQFLGHHKYFEKGDVIF